MEGDRVEAEFATRWKPEREAEDKRRGRRRRGRRGRRGRDEDKAIDQKQLE